MQDAPDTQAPDEAFESFAALRLLFRGLVLAAWAGAAWHLPTGSAVLDALAAVAAVFLAYLAFLPLVPSSIVARNVLCRMLSLRPPHGVMVALGIGMLSAMLALAAVLFRLARYMVTPL